MMLSSSLLLFGFYVEVIKQLMLPEYFLVAACKAVFSHHVLSSSAIPAKPDINSVMRVSPSKVATCTK